VAKDHPLDLGVTREAALARAAQIVERAWQEFDHPRPSEPQQSAELTELLQRALPAAGMDAVAGIDFVADVLDNSWAQSRPRYLAFIGASGLEVGVLADMLVAAYDVNVCVDSKAANRVEEQALRWLGEYLGYPVDGGSFTSGGQVSNLTALAAARERMFPGTRRTGMNGVRAAVYVSDEAHYSVRRAVEVLGLGSDSIRSIPIDSQRRMNVDALRERIAVDLAARVRPMAIVATGGTTLTGAVDPINALADVAADHGMWLHVDGAYGLPAAGTTQARALFAGLERADSLSIDAHKWLFVPKACSAVLMKDHTPLARAFSHNEAYMPHEDGALNPVDMTLEYSRPARAVKLWLAFLVYGADRMREAVAQHLELAQLMYSLGQADPEFETLPNSPQLSIAPLRHVLPGCPDINAHNMALTFAMQRDGRVFISPGQIDATTYLRPCFVNYRTDESDVRAVIDVAKEIGRSICPAHE
jgi:aromatic-L-amino-acid decarboxylase